MMPGMLTASTAPRHGGNFPKVAILVLLTLCLVPILALFSVETLLSRGCTSESASQGEAGGVLVWRIEHQRCGPGPIVSNVLLAPRGKSFALVASSTGSPRPIGVERRDDGTTLLQLQSTGADGGRFHVLHLKSTGRPKRPLVLADGQIKP